MLTRVGSDDRSSSTTTGPMRRGRKGLVAAAAGFAATAVGFGVYAYSLHRRRLDEEAEQSRVRENGFIQETLHRQHEIWQAEWALCSDFLASQKIGSADSSRVDASLAAAQWFSSNCLSCRQQLQRWRLQGQMQRHGMCDQFDKARHAGRLFLQGMNQHVKKRIAAPEVQSFYANAGRAEMFGAYVVTAPLDAVYWRDVVGAIYYKDVTWPPLTSFGVVATLNASARDEDYTNVLRMLAADDAMQQLDSDQAVHAPADDADRRRILADVRTYIRSQKPATTPFKMNVIEQIDRIVRRP
eukprot:ANDGO_01734.mRNA.1 hypothetical protein